ncbi:Glycosyltransferase involved in cell wall bisynthesis [Psychrobacillus sp. OK028]|uniref:glycosyltransferase family 4 protein n=1 Tax=Psychrobacillus sp. OK028 TaxID=1884359 RepID=UPI00087E7967|nr:glycosyltransferase family 4 protein [Psychrobacillus sp. OK028]SDO00653.1 Glycosyltransferase involved in cell wall bisynthesis [Psychrobacillus sp. OK028]
MINIKQDVAILCQYFYPEHVSSATLITELALGFKKKGLDVGVVCGYPHEFISNNFKKIQLNENLEGVSIKRVKYTMYNNKSKFGRISNFFSLFLSMFTKFFYLRKFKIIIVYSNPPILPLITYLLKKVCGTEFIFVAFDVYPDNALKINSIKENGIIHRLMNFINNRVYSNASNVVLLGNEMKDYVLRHKIAKSSKNLKVIPNWFSNEEIVQSLLVVNNEFKEIKNKYKFIVLYSGNMGPVQDMDTILQGILRFKNKEDIFFVFSGHGSKVEYVKDFLKNNKIKNSKVFGFLQGQDYADVLSISSLCLVSLEKGIEGLGVPSKTYGYLAAGKPVLSIMSPETDIAKDLAEFECGVNVAQGNITDFENGINRYFLNLPLTEMESVNAKKLYETKYTKEINIDKYYKLI